MTVLFGYVILVGVFALLINAAMVVGKVPNDNIEAQPLIYKAAPQTPTAPPRFPVVFEVAMRGKVAMRKYVKKHKHIPTIFYKYGY